MDDRPDYLRWNQNDAIRFDNGLMLVEADYWYTRDGWRWSAVVTPYVVDSDTWTGEGDPPVVLGKANRKLVTPATSEADARAQAEAWIVAAVEKIKETKS